MKTRWYKVLRDLLQNKTRSVLAILAIAIGVSGFGSLLSTYSILTRELNAGYLETNPASATSGPIGLIQELTKEVQNFPGIDEVEERRSINARIRVGANEWRNAVLFIIKDYSNIRVSRLKPEKGMWPPADREILIERDALGVARAKIGDSLLLKLPDGSEHSLRLTGSVHDVGQAQARMEQLVYGYVTLNTWKQIGQEPYLDQWKIVVSGNKFQEAHVRNTIFRLKNFIESKGHPVRRLEIPKPGEHPHADLMGTLLLFKASFGLFAFALERSAGDQSAIRVNGRTDPANRNYESNRRETTPGHGSVFRLRDHSQHGCAGHFHSAVHHRRPERFQISCRAF